MEGETGNVQSAGEAAAGDEDKETKNNESSILSDYHHSSFRDESTECAICLESLHDNTNNREVIELTTCGHRWHLECLKEQLQNAQPNPAQRLVLTGCRCAKCGSVCDHPALRQWTRTTDVLRDKVDAVLREQLEDGLLRNHPEKEEEALEEARRTFAVYLCSHCKEPYFGGTIACADTAEGEVPPEERLCVACAPTRLLQQAHCRHPLEHRGHHIWKCRYCCQVATHVCYGVVHLCHDCHDRNSERVEQIRQQQWRTRRQQRETTNRQEPPACLQSIPCPGDACPFPKPAGETHHRNGKSADCEQVYACGWCQSNPTADHAFAEPPGSRNLLLNSSGEYGLRGWQQTVNPRAQWRVEESEVPLGNGISTNFVSTFQWCVMSQVVPLHRFVRDPSQIYTEASAKYMARTDCASVFRIELILVDRNRRLLTRRHTEQLTAPADFWDRASLTVEPTPGAHEAIVVVYGKDVPFWAGYFGSKVCDIKVRVLGSLEELNRVMIPEEERVGGRGDWMRGLFPINGGEERLQPQAQQLSFWRSIFAIVLPVVCLVILSQLLL